MIKDSVIYVVGEIAAKATPFFLLPYVARKLGASGYGELANIQAYIVLALIVVCLNQDGAVVRYYYRYGSRAITTVVRSGLLYSVGILALLLVYSLLTRNLLVLYVACASFGQSLLSVQLALRQCQKEAVGYVTIQLSYAVTMAVLTVLFLELIEPRYEYYVIAIILSAVLTGAIAAVFYRKPKFRTRKTSRNHLKLSLIYILAYGAPLIFHQLSFFLKGQFDRILIHEVYPLEGLGVYSAGFQVASVFSVILMAINKATVPYYYTALKSGRLDASTTLTLTKYLLVMAPIPAAIASVFPDSFYIFFLGAQFEGVKQYVVLFLLGLGLNMPYLAMVNFLFYHSENAKISLASSLSAIVHVISLILCSYLFGLAYMPLSLLVSNVFLIALLYQKCLRFTRVF